MIGIRGNAGACRQFGIIDKNQLLLRLQAYSGDMNQSVFPLAALVAAALVPSVAHADAEGDPQLTPYADIRYRLELVDRDGLPENATASTLRVRAGVKLGEWNGFSAQVEGEAIARIGPEDYNDTVNGRTAFPVVADPSDILLNQAFVRWRPDPVVEATVGRQAVNVENQRWIGSVGWRQNDQTLDAGRVTLKPAKGLALDYLYAWRVNRVFGPDSPQGIWHDTNIHGARAAYDISGIGTISAYGYWLDVPASPASSSKTMGVRLSGAQPVGQGPKLLYTAEYARQSDQANNPADLKLDYLLVEPGIAVSGFTLKGGFERLEGNGQAGLQTPLATLHAFNGWADKFLSTPGNGLRDLYADAAYKFGEGSALKGLTLRAVYHDFDSTKGNLDYGTEWNAQVGYPLNKRINLLAKFASYRSDGFGTDTRKAWFQVEAKF